MANRLTEYAYNDATRTNTVTNAELEATQVKYNQRFQTIEVKGALNQTFQFNYDPLGRLLSQTRAGGTMSIEYDEVGNRKKRVDTAGRTTVYDYDSSERFHHRTGRSPSAAESGHLICCNNRTYNVLTIRSVNYRQNGGIAILFGVQAQWTLTAGICPH